MIERTPRLRERAESTRSSVSVSRQSRERPLRMACPDRLSAYGEAVRSLDLGRTAGSAADQGVAIEQPHRGRGAAGQLARAVSDALHDRLEVEPHGRELVLHGDHGAQDRDVQRRTPVDGACLSERRQDRVHIALGGRPVSLSPHQRRSRVLPHRYIPSHRRRTPEALTTPATLNTERLDHPLGQMGARVGIRRPSAVSATIARWQRSDSTTCSRPARASPGR